MPGSALMEAATVKTEVKECEQTLPRNVSNTSTLTNIICVVAGSGALSIPHALSRSGWIGLAFLVLSALMAQFAGCLLIRCLYHGQTTRLADFGEIGFATFGRPGQYVGTAFSQLLLLFTPTVYFILAGDNMAQLLATAGHSVDRKTCTWILAAAVGLPFTMVRHMRDVSFMSFFASMATVCLLLVVTVVSMSDFQANGLTAHHDWAIPSNIPIAFSTFSFAYCGNVIYPHLEASMSHPSSWSKVLLVATSVVTIMYLLLGFICYLVYGNAVQSPVFKSIPAGSPQNVAMIVITIHVLLAIPIYLYVFTLSVESWLGARKGWPAKYPTWTRVATRVSEVVLCALVAMLVPYFADFMSLIGTLAAECLTFVLPCVFWIKLSWQRGWNRIEVVACCIVALIGTICAVFGTISAVRLLVDDFAATV